MHHATRISCMGDQKFPTTVGVEVKLGQIDCSEERSEEIINKYFSLKKCLTIKMGQGASDFNLTSQTRDQRYKTFFFVFHEYLRKARVSIPGNPFQPSVMFAGKARRLWAPLWGKLFGLLANIRLERIAKDKNSSLSAPFVNHNSEKFYNIGPWSNPSSICQNLQHGGLFCKTFYGRKYIVSKVPE